MYPVYLLCNRRKTLTGSPDPTHANGTNKPCILVSKDEEEELLDTASTTSSVAGGARPKTLSQMKSQHSKVDPYPNKCPIASAQLFFPTSQQDLHQAGVPAKYISHREEIGPYKGLYTCNKNAFQ